MVILLKKIIKLLSLIISMCLVSGCNNTNHINTDGEEIDLIVYSGHSKELTNFYLKEFQERTNLKTKAILGGGTEIIDLVNNDDSPTGDVIIGVGSDSLESNNDMFAEYSSIHLNKIDDGYNSEEKRWIGDFRIPMVIIYNKQIISEEDIPNSWLDLLNPKFNGQIAMGNPVISGSTYTQLVTLLTIFEKKEEAWNFIEQLAQNMNGITLDNTLDVPLKVHEGEYVLGITLESYAYEYLQHNSNLGFVYPIEGTTARASGVALLKDSPNVENAKSFIDFLLEPETGEMVGKNFYRRSAHKDVSDPVTLESSTNINIIDYDYQWASINRIQNLEEWKKIFSQIRESNGD